MHTGDYAAERSLKDFAFEFPSLCCSFNIGIQLRGDGTFFRLPALMNVHTVNSVSGSMLKCFFHLQDISNTSIVKKRIWRFSHFVADRSSAWFEAQVFI